MDESHEVSAFAILLLFSDWGPQGEVSLSRVKAITRLQEVKPDLPSYILRSLERIQRSETILADSGEPDVEFDAEGITCIEGFRGQQCEESYGSCVTGMSTIANVERITTRAPANQVAFLHAYVESVKASYDANHEAATVLSPEERALKESNPDAFIAVAGADVRQARLDEEVEQLTSEQRRAYLKAVDHLSGRTGQQMVMLLSGEGGTGKSKVIGAICAFAELLHGKTIGSWGAVLKTAPTGAAAHNIGGCTWHSALSKTNNAPELKELTSGVSVELQRRAFGTALFVLDEVSLLSCASLADISYRLSVATGQASTVFGGLHTLLVGDFYQMRPVGAAALVETAIPPQDIAAVRGRDILVTSLTDFCMLTVNIRASAAGGMTASPLARFCSRIRVGDVSDAVLHTMNDRVVNTIEVAMRQASPMALWITSTHNKVAEINNAYKERRLNNNEQMFTIIARHIPSKAGSPALTPKVRRKLYAEAGDRKGRRDSLMLSHMDLFVGSRVRLTRNLFVQGGLYNGAMGTVWGFVFRGDGTLPEDITGKQRLYGDMEDYQREIPVVLVQMDGDDASFPYSCSTSVPRLVPITAIQSPGLVCGEYNRLQLPILPAEARTGHSIQGLTAHHGVVVQPGSTFFAGDYTAISRAKTKDGILLLSPLLEAHFCNAKHETYRTLIKAEYERLELAFPQL
jgi:hypothetical protein